MSVTVHSPEPLLPGTSASATAPAAASMIDGFGMDTITLAGPLEARLAAMRAAGFAQVMLGAPDVAALPGGVDAAAALVRASGLRPTGFQVLRDFEGLSGHLHGYKLDIAKAMLTMCRALGSDILLACSSTSRHATDDPDAIARDLAKLATLALPLGIRVAYEALSWGRVVNELVAARDLVELADMPNLGLGIDSFHLIAAGTSPEEIESLAPDGIFLVQLSDFMWREAPTFEERKATARTFRVFPGEGVHDEAIVEIVRRLDRIGYRGDWSFEVFNEDYRQLPPEMVCRRARASAEWLARDVLGRTAPLPPWTREAEG